MSSVPVTIDSRVSVSVEYRKPTLSPTALDHATICGRRLQYYLDPDQPHGGTNLALAKGRAWHWMMEQWGRARIWAQTHNEGRLDLAEGWVETLYGMGVGYLSEIVSSDEFVSAKDDNLGEAFDQLWTMLMVWVKSPDARWEGPGITFEAVEQKVLTEMGSAYHQMQGYIDAVLTVQTYAHPELAHYEGLGGVTSQTVLVDYKSAGRSWGTDKVRFDQETNRHIGDPRKIPQGPLYAEAWERVTGDRVDWVCFDVMTVKGKFMRVWVPVHLRMREPMLERWRQVSNEVNMYREAGVDMPANPSHFMCSERWCPFWDRCPLGAPYKEQRKAREQ